MRAFESGVPMSVEAEEKMDFEEVDKIRCFIEDKELTSAQIEEAYHRLAGVWEGKEDAAPAVGELRSMMETSGLTYTHFARFIGERRDYEAAIDKLASLIDELDTTSHEKDVLKSIVREWRPGMLAIVDPASGEYIEETIIPKFDPSDEAFKKEIAHHLLTRLSKYKEKKIEIQFIEA